MSQDVDALCSGILGRDPGDNAGGESETEAGSGSERVRESDRVSAA